jgi:hypothetical protein
MADVFLSYSSNDRAAAERVQAALSARGIDVFWDQETPPGVDWDTWIRSKLTACKVAVVLWSKESIASPNVRHEAIVARDAGKLVPAMVESLTPEDFPMGLYLVQAVLLQDWRNPGSRGMARLVSEVEARLGGGAAPRARPRRAPAQSAGGGKASMVLAGFVAIALAAGGGVWWMMQNTKGAGAEEAAEAGGELFSKRMVGRWNWTGLACADGPNVTFEGGQLVFTTPDTKFVHVIEKDTTLETHTRVVEPEYVLGEQYVLTPEYNATSDTRNFNLVVKNLTTGGGTNTWSPCEL